jgi:hypothetical protein
MMAQTIDRDDPSNLCGDPAATIRATVQELGALDRATASFLNALAFVLVRVADADRHIDQLERNTMELLLVEHAGLTRAQAVLVVEIAKHRTRLADCGCSYGISRVLRSELEPERRQPWRVPTVARRDTRRKRSARLPTSWALALTAWTPDPTQSAAPRGPAIPSVLRRSFPSPFPYPSPPPNAH